MKVNPTSAIAVSKHIGALVTQKTVQSPNSQ